MPKFAAFAMLFAMANSGLPGTSGFVGEFWVILSSYQANIWVAFFAATTLILGAAYTLWMYKRVFFGDAVKESVKSLTDINRREWLILAVLALFTLLFGLWPQPIVEVVQPSVEHLLRCGIETKLATMTNGVCH
ncbi:MAG: NADH-quinone oxidoreductase subunit M, partial [Gammaproteobacteria bacterium]